MYMILGVNLLYLQPGKIMWFKCLVTEWVQRHEFEELKIEREEMRKKKDELCDLVKQLMESLNFQPKPYIRDQVHEDDI